LRRLTLASEAVHRFLVIPSKRSLRSEDLGEPREASQPALSEAEGFFAAQ
jgi:hypothetical protein